MDWVHRFFRSDDGLRLHVTEWPGPRADAPVLLCLHGLTRNGRDFERLAAHLCPRFRLLCPDQRGRGLSAHDPDPSRYRPDRYVADMLTLLDQAAIAQVQVIGTSLGGMMGVMLAALQPQRIQALVLNDVGPVLEPAGLTRIAGYVGHQAAATSLTEAAARTAAVQAPVFPDFEPQDWQRMVLETHRIEDGHWLPDYDPAIAQGLASGSAVPPLWPLFEAAAATPMLLLRGAESDLLSAATMAEMQARLPKLQAAEVPRRGHAPTLMEPEALRALEDFLQGPR